MRNGMHQAFLKCTRAIEKMQPAFFEHLAQLDDIYVLKGNQVVDFISRGINMI